MSISRTVYVQRTNLPSAKEWADAVRAAGFPMELDSDFALESHEGFLPVTYEGKPAGFEYFYSLVGEDEDGEDREHPEVGDRDVGITFVTHSSMRELVTAVIAAAILCERSDGIVYDHESGDTITASEAVASARELIASVGEDLD